MTFHCKPAVLLHIHKIQNYLDKLASRVFCGLGLPNSHKACLQEADFLYHVASELLSQPALGALGSSLTGSWTESLALPHFILLVCNNCETTFLQVQVVHTSVLRARAHTYNTVHSKNEEKTGGLCYRKRTHIANVSYSPQFLVLWGLWREKSFRGQAQPPGKA